MKLNIEIVLNSLTDDQQALLLRYIKSRLNPESIKSWREDGT